MTAEQLKATLRTASGLCATSTVTCCIMGAVMLCCPVTAIPGVLMVAGGIFLALASVGTAAAAALVPDNHDTPERPVVPFRKPGE